jgi:cell division protein ZapA
MATEPQEPITVEIFGTTYTVRGGHDREQLGVVAALVDAKMRAIGAHLPQAEPGRLAILAALNLADELLELKRQLEGERVDFATRADAMKATLERALART